MIKDVIIHSVEAWAIPGLMNWNNLEPLASETRKALLVHRLISGRHTVGFKRVWMLGASEERIRCDP